MSSSDYDEELRGALFVNKDKTKDPEDKRPDRNGYLVVGGNRLELAGWLRRSKKTGEPFLSLKAQFPRPKGNGGTAPAQAQPVQAAPVVQPTTDPDDVPF